MDKKRDVKMREEIQYVHDWFEENKSLLEETNAVLSPVDTPVGKGYFKLANDYLKIMFSVLPWGLTMDALTLDDMQVLMFGDFMFSTPEERDAVLRELIDRMNILTKDKTIVWKYIGQ